MHVPAAEALQRFMQYESERSYPPIYTLPASIDAWAHRYVRAMILPILQDQPGARWLTLGDGFFGADAHFLKLHGAKATASALMGEVLAEAQQLGWIDNWQVENAEAIQQGDAAFDFTLCMETLQHCTRPQAALDEMLRVSSQAVAIMGCVERQGKALDRIRDRIRAKIRHTKINAVETYQGVPIFRMNITDLVAHSRAAGVQCIAFKRFNMLPAGRFWNLRAAASSPAFLVYRAAMGLLNLASKLGLLTYSLGWFVLFKQAPSAALQSALKANGFELAEI